MKFEQVSVAKNVIYFKEGIKQKWGLNDYIDPYAPCLFFGVSQQADLINKHKGYKLLYFVDNSDTFLPSIDKKNVISFYNPFAKIPSDIPVKHGWIETRNNDIITPTILNDKVFVYLRRPQDGISMGSKIIEELQKKINYEIITLSQDPPIPFQNVVEEYYKKSFVSVNFTTNGGLTTVCDLGLMGIKTIMNTQIDLRSLLKCNSLDEVPHLIENESKKIGTIQDPINNYTLNEVWQNVEFWLT